MRPCEIWKDKCDAARRIKAEFGTVLKEARRWLLEGEDG